MCVCGNGFISQQTLTFFYFYFILLGYFLLLMIEKFMFGTKRQCNAEKVCMVIYKLCTGIYMLCGCVYVRVFWARRFLNYYYYD